MRRASRPTPSAPLGARRDRRGRGMRGVLASGGVPLVRTRSEAFDDLVLDAVDELAVHWSAELAGVQFAVEEVPPAGPSLPFDPEVVLDRGVALGRLFRGGPGQPADLPDPTVVIYRRPVEARASSAAERGEVVFMVVAELVAELLGRDLDEFGGFPD